MVAWLILPITGILAAAAGYSAGSGRKINLKSLETAIGLKLPKKKGKLKLVP